jgi:hypothetical protein
LPDRDQSFFGSDYVPPNTTLSSHNIPQSQPFKNYIIDLQKDTVLSALRLQKKKKHNKTVIYDLSQINYNNLTLGGRSRETHPGFTSASLTRDVNKSSIQKLQEHFNKLKQGSPVMMSTLIS